MYLTLDNLSTMSLHKWRLVIELLVKFIRIELVNDCCVHLWEFLFRLRFALLFFCDLST